MSIPPSPFFFQSILPHKTWRRGGELLLKNVQQVVTPTNHVIARAGFKLLGAPGTLEFSQHLPAKYR